MHLVENFLVFEWVEFWLHMFNTCNVGFCEASKKTGTRIWAVQGRRRASKRPINRRCSSTHLSLITYAASEKTPRIQKTPEVMLLQSGELYRLGVGGSSMEDGTPAGRKQDIGGLLPTIFRHPYPRVLLCLPYSRF